MGRNIEIKARACDFHRQKQIAEALSETEPLVLEQVDTFFRCREGRLKLRMTHEGRGELIFYQRSDEAGPKESSYLIAPTVQPRALKQALAAAYGIRSVVRKTRTLCMSGQTRIHLDEVDGLGAFLELEVVMQPGQSVAEGTRMARALMEKLDIRNSDLVTGAYIDLLEAGPDLMER